MKIYGLQWDIRWEDKPGNFEIVRRLTRQAAPERGSLVVLPEMFATGFSMNAVAIAEDCDGHTEQFLSGLASSLQCSVLAGAAIRDTDGRPRNKCLVFGPDGKLAASYTKIRPFNPGGESAHYTAGDKVCLFDWGGVSTAPFICYDLRFPELFREAARVGRPRLLAVIASWPAKRLHHWPRLLQARAIENQSYVIGVNRIGSDPSFEYAGRSIIVDPQGEIIADAGSLECVISASLDIESLDQYRKGLPFLDDME